MAIKSAKQSGSNRSVDLEGSDAVASVNIESLDE